MSPSALIAKFLSTNSVGTLGGSTDFSIHSGYEPSSPENVVTIYDTEGGEYMPDINQYEGRIQVRCRSNDYQSGYTKMIQIFETLETDTKCFDVDGVPFIGAFSTSNIFHLGRDDNDLFLFTQNFKLLRESL